MKPGATKVRLTRWALGALAVLAAPKCLLCIAGYGMALLGIGVLGREICGVRVDGIGAAAPWIIGAVGAIATVTWAVRRGRRRV